METLFAPEIILCENNASFILKSTRKRFVFEIESKAVVYYIKKNQGRQPWVRRISGQYSSLQAALLVLEIYYIWVSFCWEGSYFLSAIMVSVGIYT